VRKEPFAIHGHAIETDALSLSANAVRLKGRFQTGEFEVRSISKSLFISSLVNHCLVKSLTWKEIKRRVISKIQAALKGIYRTVRDDSYKYNSENIGTESAQTRLKRRMASETNDWAKHPRNVVSWVGCVKYGTRL